ncbi:MAG: type I pullulanase [Lachnospiraceae bacterium]|nr:type I pullulanase [Lachnospiraceae bacterium]
MLPARSVRAEGGPVIKLHYHREDGLYDPWDVWMWPEGGEGAGYAFAETDGEMVATMEAEPGVSKVGFIVRTQDWEKDIAEDQFIDISEMVSGTVHIYVESGVPGYTKEYGEDAVTGTKLKTAVYNATKKVITLTLTGDMSEEQKASIYVTGRQGDVEIEMISDLPGEQYTYEVLLAEELDSYRNYRIGFEDAQYPVRMPNLYSTDAFEAAYTYDGDDLGFTYTPGHTDFRVWAPTAESVTLNLYESGNNWLEDLREEIPMTRDVKGTWIAGVDGDLNGTYYTFTALLDGAMVEACDPYARTTGVNGKRAMVIDLDATDPAGWEKDGDPHAGSRITDAVIYEVHVRDFSVDESAGMKNPGKYLAFTETGTTTANGIATGIDHIRQLGITHVHLLPVYDFGSVDETHTSAGLYNWGYDPVNYNVPEGSYSTDPSDGAVRVKEFKQMVQALHQNDLSVIMDVVYNHVYSSNDFCVNRLVPGYFSRVNEDGTYSNGSGCGNDTASERSMVRKYIVDSVCYWADEYHIDGFRFDLVGLLDVDTVNDIVEEVHRDHPNVIFYGEGWSMNTAVTKEGVVMATQQASARTPGFAYFNDNIRDGLKGSVFNTGEVGYVSGARDKERAISMSFLADETWSVSPSQVVQYASCHDNMTLYDRLAVSRTDASETDLIRMNNLAAAIYLTAQGVPFMQAGEEILRTKVKEDGTFDSNSYASGDEINSIKWSTLDDTAYRLVNSYYQGLIAFRHTHPSLRLATAEEVRDVVTSIDGLDKNITGFLIDGTRVAGETAETICLLFNPTTTSNVVNLPEGNWNVYVSDTQAGTEAISSLEGYATVAPISAMVLIREEAPQAAEGSDEVAEAVRKGNPGAVTKGIMAGILAVAAGIAVFIGIRSRRKK